LLGENEEKQSEKIISKEKAIEEMKKENDMLKKAVVFHYRNNEV
jgi:hypothetical protein